MYELQKGEAMREVRIFEPVRDHQEMRDEIMRAFTETLSSGSYILGEQVKLFEEAFAQYLGVKYAVGVNSGTDAIKIGGLALGLQAGDKMVTTPNTYISTAMALSTQGIIPLFCDIERETYNMDPGKLEEILRKETGVKLCAPVHLYGHPCRMDEIKEVCGRHGVMVLEDACQAHGSRYKEKKVGSLGDAAAFSFYPTKNLGCYGDGGMIATDSEAVYRNAIMLRAYGQEGKHIHVAEGFNSRLDEVQAAILRVKLPRLDEVNVQRRYRATLYGRELQGTPMVLPHEATWAYHVYHLYVVRSKAREELMRFLAGRGVGTLVHYPTPIHRQKVYDRLGYGQGSFPEAEAAAGEILSLPMYPTLQEDEILYVCQSIREFYGL
jgi:dTDP-4-amino-4,6-dideoxygalactose transaminase